METALIIAGALAVGIALGVLYSAASIRHLRRQAEDLRAALDAGRKPKAPETMKLVVWACVVNGFAWVWCSYILAALDKPQIAEELSKVALIEIVAPVFAYAAKSAIENLSKNNRWPDRGYTTENAPPEETGGEGGIG